MRNVEILKPVSHLGEIVKPLPVGGPVLSVPDHTAEHWIATGAAKAVADAPPPDPDEDDLPKPKKGKAF